MYQKGLIIKNIGISLVLPLILKYKQKIKYRARILIKIGRV